ncbi:MAG: HTH domain-containing protein [Candidatus Altimarinota bacterium]
MRTIFNSEQIAQLSAHPCVWRVSERSIHYTYDFKKRALDLYAQGIKPDDIWKQAGFDVSIWKKDYCRYTLKDWRRLVKKGGLESLTKPSGIQADGGYKRSRSPEADRVRRLELQVRYLEAENAFLAHLRANRAESNSGLAKNTNSSGN